MVKAASHKCGEGSTSHCRVEGSTSQCCVKGNTSQCCGKGGASQGNTSQCCGKGGTSQGWSKGSTSQCCGTAIHNAVLKSAPHNATVLAARSWQQHPYVYPSSGARLVHLSVPACRLLVLAAAPCIHAALLDGSTFGVVLAARIGSGAHARCDACLYGIIGLQHSSGRAGCS